MRLFICHASEDKADLVQPLAEALRREHDVWYDKFVLTMGDSLLQKINEGLASCDYGIVIFSRAFFDKKWPRAELDGLFALETTARKIILPIWKDVSESEVKTFSPILAGRLAVQASEGIETIVGEIRRAVDVSNRTREIGASNAVAAKIKSIDTTLKEKRHAEHLMHCEEGVALIRQSLTGFVEALKSIKAQTEATSEILRFQLLQPAVPDANGICIVRSLYQLELNVQLSGLGGNFTDECLLWATIFQGGERYHGQIIGAARVKDLKFKPTFQISSNVLWVEEVRNLKYSENELAAYMIEQLVAEIEKRIK